MNTRALGGQQPDSPSRARSAPRPQFRSNWLLTLLVSAIVISGAAPPAAAHDFGFARTVVALLPDGGFRVDMVIDLDALALGVSPDTDNTTLVRILNAMTTEDREQAVENLRQTFLRRVRIRFDDDPVSPEVAFPDRGTPRARDNNTVLGLVARLTGNIPPQAVELTIQASRAFPPLHLSVVDVRGHRDPAPYLATIDNALRRTFREPAGVGDTPPQVVYSARFDALVTYRQVLERGLPSDPYPLDRPPPAPNRLDVIRQYLVLGCEHIVPLGVDHILFVLGLFLLNTSWRPLLAQVTAFTAAHTLSLGLSTYGVVSLSPAIVEPLIALSIAWVAFENVAMDQLQPWRPAVVFGFGLLHGLGFAGVLAELGLPRGEYLTALLSFNAGVELGQLTVILGAFVLIGWLRDRPWYRSRVTVPLSLAIGMVGLYWAITRLFGS